MLTSLANGIGVLAEATPERKDVVIAMLGASAALGGLVLVFLGTLITAYQGIAAEEATKRIRGRFKRAAVPILVVFFLSLASVALGAIWLDAHGGSALYEAGFIVFLIELGAICALATWTASRMLK